jgi:DNA-binding transcriptional LysR family regulator
MNNESALDWDNIRYFLAVGRSGTLSEAARDLGMSVATLARRIDSLEAQLNIKLLRKSPKGAQLTSHGEAIMRFAEPGARQINQISRFARALVGEPNQPSVRISATEGVIADILAPFLPKLCQDNPDISIDLEVSNQIADLNSGRTDVAIRMTRPTEETLIGMRLPTIRLGLFGSHNYLKGRESQKMDLGKERLIWLDRAYGDIAENIWLQSQGLDRGAIIRSSSVRALFNAATAGVGIAPLPVFTAQAAGLIQLSQYTLPERHPWLVFHTDTKNVPRLKTVRDWIAKAFKHALG